MFVLLQELCSEQGLFAPQVTELQTGEAVPRFLIAFLLDPSPLLKCLQFLHLALEMSL